MTSSIYQIREGKLNGPRAREVRFRNGGYVTTRSVGRRQLKRVGSWERGGGRKGVRLFPKSGCRKIAKAEKKNEKGSVKP